MRHALLTDRYDETPRDPRLVSRGYLPIVSSFAPQTGSGKTFTMNGIVTLAARDIFDRLHEEQMRANELPDYNGKIILVLSSYAIYNGKLYVTTDQLLSRLKLHFISDSRV